MTGYDPNASLLPSSGGTIHAMSGGGMEVPPITATGQPYNETQSLLSAVPPSAGAIVPYRGGGDLPLGGADPTFAAPPRSADATPLPSEPTPEPTPVLLPTPSPMQVAPSAMVPTTIPSTEQNVTITLPVETPSSNEKPAEDKKTLVLFGITMELENPKRKNNTEDFTENQKKVLADLGLDGPAVSFKQKRDVLQTIYDEKCRTEQSLMMLQNCEPIRQIVQTLALQLLETLRPANDAANSVIEQDKPVVTYTKDDAKKTTTVSITFGPGQLQQLSAERLKNKNKNKNKNKIRIRIRIRKTKNQNKNKKKK